MCNGVCLGGGGGGEQGRGCACMWTISILCHCSAYLVQCYQATLQVIQGFYQDRVASMASKRLCVCGCGGRVSLCVTMRVYGKRIGKGRVLWLTFVCRPSGSPVTLFTASHSGVRPAMRRGW